MHELGLVEAEQVVLRQRRGQVEGVARHLAGRAVDLDEFRAAADGTLKLLEVNPNPSWRWDDDPAIMAGLAGWSYAELLGRLIAAAQARVHTAAVPAKLAAP